MSAADRHPAAGAVLPAGALAAAVLAWWAATALLSIPTFVLPPPTAVAARLAGNPALYARNALTTVMAVLVGGAVGASGGFLLAVVLARSTLVRRALYPYVVAVRVLPKVAVAPLLLVYVGLGFDTEVAFVALVSFFPMVVSTLAGFRRVPARQYDLLASVGAPAHRTLLAVELRYALPDAFAGLKQTVTLAVVGAVVAEWIVATEGLGYLVLLASETVQPAVLLAALAVLVVVGLGLYGAVAALQRRVDWTA